LINLASHFEVVPLELKKKNKKKHEKTKKQDVNCEKFSLDFGSLLWANELLDAKKLWNLLLS